MFTDKQFYMLLGLGAGVLYLVHRSGQRLGEAVNPLNQDNVFAGLANDATQALSGRDTDKFGRPLTFGAWLAEATGAGEQ